MAEHNSEPTVGPERHRARHAAPGFIAAATLIILAAWALRLWNLDTQSLWHDEGWSIYAGYTPAGPMGIRGSDFNAPPAYYTSLHLWMRVAGDAVWTLRYLSTLYSVLIVALIALVGRRWFGPVTGLLAALFVAVNPMLWVFSQEIRAYITMPLAAVLLLILADHFAKGRDEPVSRILWARLLCVEFLALYAHNLSVPLVAWLNVTLIAVMVGRRAWRRLAFWIGWQGVVLIGYLPWLITQRQTGTPLNNPPRIDLNLIANIWNSYFTGIKALFGADSNLTAMIGLFGVAAVIAMLWAVVRLHSRRGWLVASQVILLPVFQFGIVWAAHIDFHPRYFILSVPATLLLIAVTLGKIRLEAKRAPIRMFIWGLHHSAQLGACFLAISIYVRTVEVTFSLPGYQHDDFRSVARRYAALGHDDAVIVPYQWEPSIDYYRPKLPITARFIEVPLHSSADHIITMLRDELIGVQEAEVITWTQLPADVRGAFPCLLSVMGGQIDTFQVSGVRTDRYVIRDPARLMPLVEAPDESSLVDFGVLRLIGQAIYPPTAEGDACVILKWQLPAPTDVQWRVSVRVPKASGGYWAQVDSDILDNNQMPTPLWRAGDTSASFARIALPPEAPDGPLPVEVYVYDAATWATQPTATGEMMAVVGTLRR